MRKWLVFLPVVLLIMVTGAVAKSTSELSSFVASLQHQFRQQISEETGSSAAVRQQVAEVLESGLVTAFLRDPQLTNLDSQVFFLSIEQAAGKSLDNFSALDFAQCYADSSKNYDKFVSLVKHMAKKRRIAINWQSSTNVKALNNIFEACRRISASQKGATVSGHYSGSGWSGEARAVWYPTEGKVYLYYVDSTNYSPGIKNIICNLVGSVSSTYTDGHLKPVVKLCQSSLKYTSRVQNFSGQWTLPNQTFASQSDSFLVNNTVRLKLSGYKAEGRLVETFLSSSGGDPATIVITLNGQMNDAGSMSGTASASGNPQILQKRFGTLEGLDNLGWSAHLEGSKVKGVINLGGSADITWQGTLK